MLTKAERRLHIVWWLVTIITGMLSAAAAGFAHDMLWLETLALGALIGTLVGGLFHGIWLLG